mgnify:CR=1 FL=1
MRCGLNWMHWGPIHDNFFAHATARHIDFRGNLYLRILLSARLEGRRTALATLDLWIARSSRTIDLRFCAFGYPRLSICVHFIEHHAGPVAVAKTFSERTVRVDLFVANKALVGIANRI